MDGLLAASRPQNTSHHGHKWFGNLRRPRCFDAPVVPHSAKTDRLAHPEYERLIAQASRSLNQDERLRFYRQADALLICEAPLIPMSYHDPAFLAKPRVKRMPHSPVSAYTFWKNVVLDPVPTGR